MSERERSVDETRVWRGEDVRAALEPPRRSRRRERPPSGRGSRGWQLTWRLVLWAFALGIGWYAGTRYFG